MAERGKKVKKVSEFPRAQGCPQGTRKIGSRCVTGRGRLAGVLTDTDRKRDIPLLPRRARICPRSDYVFDIDGCHDPNTMELKWAKPEIAARVTKKPKPAGNPKPKKSKPVKSPKKSNPKTKKKPVIPKPVVPISRKKSRSKKQKPKRSRRSRSRSHSRSGSVFVDKKKPAVSFLVPVKPQEKQPPQEYDSDSDDSIFTAVQFERPKAGRPIINPNVLRHDDPVEYKGLIDESVIKSLERQYAGAVEDEEDEEEEENWDEEQNAKDHEIYVQIFPELKDADKADREEVVSSSNHGRITGPIKMLGLIAKLRGRGTDDLASLSEQLTNSMIQNRQFPVTSTIAGEMQKLGLDVLRNYLETQCVLYIAYVTIIECIRAKKTVDDVDDILFSEIIDILIEYEVDPNFKFIDYLIKKYVTKEYSEQEITDFMKNLKPAYKDANKEYTKKKLEEVRSKSSVTQTLRGIGHYD